MEIGAALSPIGPKRQFAAVQRGPGGFVRLRIFVLHDHDGCPSPSRLNFKDSDVSPSLAQRAPWRARIHAIHGLANSNKLS
jgi:hypothetical protein